MDKIPEAQLSQVTAFLQQPLIARMATADERGRPHVVPVWYGWDGESVWISSFANTRKYVTLEKNPHLSVVIDISYENQVNQYVIFEGLAKLFKEPREFVRSQSEWIYTRYLGEQVVKASEPQSWTVDPENRIIQLIPNHIIMTGF